LVNIKKPEYTQRYAELIQSLQSEKGDK